MNENFNALFDALFGLPGSFASRESYKDDVLTITLDVPGYSKEELDISLKGSVLTITGTSESRGSSSKAYRLSPSLDQTRISAALKNGVLTITAPLTPSAAPRKVEIALAS